MSTSQSANAPAASAPAAARWKLRPLDTPEDMAAVEALSMVVWPGTELDVVPGHLLLTIAHNGGLVAGAFDGDRLIGFVFGFLGLDERWYPAKLKHCSHQLGVHPEYRSAGVGFALKHYQQRFVCEQGLDLVTWTYDPLMSRNAQLNIAKLGAVCNTYRRNVYGELRDSLNAGLPTDRFLVDWWVASDRVEGRVRGTDARQPSLAGILASGAFRVNPPGLDGTPTPPSPEGLHRRPADAPVLLEIPPDFLALKTADRMLAIAWRLGTRTVFEALFASGLVVTDFVFEPASTPRAAYVLTRPTP
jgi:predicted GNAT superfamily acetyltransferase